jgi:hypothetical protein
MILVDTERDLTIPYPPSTQLIPVSYQQIADLLGCSRWLVYNVAVEFDVRRPRGAGTPARLKGEQ